MTVAELRVASLRCRQHSTQNAREAGKVGLIRLWPHLHMSMTSNDGTVLCKRAMLCNAYLAKLLTAFFVVQM